MELFGIFVTVAWIDWEKKYEHESKKGKELAKDLMKRERERRIVRRKRDWGQAEIVLHRTVVANNT